MGWFDGSSRPQRPGRYDGPIGQHPPGFDGPVSRFDGPQRFKNMGPAEHGPMGFQQRPQMRFDRPPNQMGPMRFDGPMCFGNRPMYDQGISPRYDVQKGPRFGQPMQTRPVAPSACDNVGPQQQNFNMSNQCFPEPINPPQFAGGPHPFPAQQGLPQVGGNFNMQPGPFNQPGAPAFYNPAGPTTGNMHQPVRPLCFHPGRIKHAQMLTHSRRSFFVGLTEHLLFSR